MMPTNRNDGNVYKNTGNGWQKYDNGSWNSVSKPQPNWQGAESSQQRTGSESNQQRSAPASNDSRPSEGGFDRSGGGFDRSGAGGFDQSGGGGFGDLDREAQNRWRGGQQSERFQNFQRGGFDRFDGGGFGGDRFGGGGGFRGRR